MKTAELQKLLKQNERNRVKTANCPNHNFVHQIKPNGEMLHKYKCSSCGTTITALSMHWYTVGFQQGQKQSVNI